MAHLSYENYEFSRCLAKRAIVGLNKASADETANYIGVIQQILVVQDSLMSKRAEWILGVPQAKIERSYHAYNSPPPATVFKMGVSTLNNADSDICEYRSTLFKMSSHVKESYLQLLFQYRRRWPRYTLDSMVALFQACLMDESRWLYHYLYQMDPPTYCQARYLDWIKPYLGEQIEDFCRNANISSYKTDLSLAL